MLIKKNEKMNNASLINIGLSNPSPLPSILKSTFPQVPKKGISLRT